MRDFDKVATLATLAGIAEALQAQDRLEQLEEELRRERAEHVHTRAKLEVVEALRPHWAQGYTSDGVAAQSMSGALSSLWALLGASDQTTAVERLRELIRDYNSNVGDRWAARNAQRGG